MAWENAIESALYTIVIRGNGIFKAILDAWQINHLSGIFCVKFFCFCVGIYKRQIRAPPFDFEQFKIERRAPNGRKRKILY